MSQLERNKQVVRDYADAFSRGDLDTVARFCTPDVVVQGVLGKGGLEVVLPIWRDLIDAYGLQLQIEDLIAEGDLVAARYTERGTFRRPFRGQEPTGKGYEVVAMEWFRIRDGKIAGRWGARDSASIQRQLGTA